MATQNSSLPPGPILPRIYPWDEYNATVMLQQLYAQAQKTGFRGTYEDFKQRYGAIVEAADPQDIYDLIDNYAGPYRITPLQNIEQVLQTKNKIVNRDIIIEPIPSDLINEYPIYRGRYSVTPMANIDQLLRTSNKVLEEDIVIEKIPYAEVSNTAGGITVTIG